MTSVWIPKPAEISDLQAALAALDEIFAAAGYLAYLVVEGRRSSRGELRDRVLSLFDGRAPAGRYMNAIHRTISRKSRTILKRITPFRRPIICTGGDLQELAFKSNEDFDVTADLPISPDDGSIIIRLEVRLDGRLRIPITKTLVWEGHQDYKILGSASDAIIPTIESLVNATDESSMRSDSFCLQIQQYLNAKGVKVSNLEVHNQLLTTAVAPRILTGSLMEHSCVTGKATLELSKSDGSKGFVRVETHFLVRDRKLSVLRDSSRVSIPQYLTPKTHARWITVNAVSLTPNRNMSYNNSTTKRDEKTTITSRVINDILIGQVGFTRDELSFIFADKKQHQSAVSRMRSFLTALIGEARTDQSTDALIVNFTRLKIPLDETKRARYESRVSSLREIRDGPWDDSIDLPALNRAVYLMAELCDIFPHLIVRYLEFGIETTMGPIPPNFGYWQDGQWSKRASRPRRFILCCFDLFSRRSNPWRWMSYTEAETHSDLLERLVIGNLNKVDVQFPTLDADNSESTVIESRPVARWDRIDVLSIGRNMLNELALSKPLPLQTFPLSVDDWYQWKPLIMGDARLSLSDEVKRGIDTTLRYAWKKHFAAYAMPPPSTFVSKIQSLVSILERDEARETGGHWMAETYVQIAIFFWLIKRYPARDVSYVLSPWELNVIHQWSLPFENRSNLATVIRRHEGNIRKVYDRLLETIDEQQWTVQSLCGEFVDSATLVELKALHNEP